MLRDDIAESLRRAGLQAPERFVDQLATHARMLQETNRVLNLTRITEDREIARLHVADSLTALPWVASAPPGPLVDIGSGGGYPGIPLAILSGRPTTLVESTKKKAAFLSTVVDALGLDGRVLAERAEEAAQGHRGEFAVATARAVAPLASLVELAAPLLAQGGRFVALKGEPGVEEIAAGDRAAAVLGMRREETSSLTLPDGGEKRTIVVYRRTGDARVRVPRRSGLAQRDPLG